MLQYLGDWLEHGNLVSAILAFAGQGLLPEEKISQKQKTMRVTFILTSYSRKPIGGFRVVYEYANRLVKRGYRVNIVYCKRLKNIPESLGPLKRLKSEIYYLYKILFKPKPDWQLIDSRIKTFHVPEPEARYIPEADAVFATYWAIAEYMEKYPEEKGRKCYLFQHYETFGSKDTGEVAATWLSSFPKIIISKWLYDIGLSFNAKDMVYIPNGIDHDHFKMTAAIKDRPARVAMMYSEIPWKGAWDGISAIDLAKKQFPDLQAVLFGVGKRARDIPSWIEYRENPGQKELSESIYNYSSICLCPSHTEGFALPPAEAMSCGCAVATTDCGGIKDFCQNEKTALISPVRQPEALAKNLIRFLEDDGLRIKIAQAGYDYIQRFSWENSLDLMENFLKKYGNAESFNSNS
ncbi:MAG: glycosyltransferase family 4 protein [bacterium]